MTAQVAVDSVELEAHYEIIYDGHSYRIVSGFVLSALLRSHRIKATDIVTKIGAPQ